MSPPSDTVERPPDPSHPQPGDRSARHPVGHRRRQPVRGQLWLRWIAVLLAAAVTLTAGIAAVVATASGSADGPRAPAAGPSSSDGTAHAAPSAGPSAGLSPQQRGTSATERDAPRVLVPESGPGTFRVAPAAGSPVAGSAAGTVAYRVEVERTLPFTLRSFTVAVDATLTHRAGWSADGTHLLRRVGRAIPAELRVILATPGTTDALCTPLDTGGRLSCRNGDRVVINAWRWAHGAPTYGDDVAGYRRYVVNHEVGHGLGMPHVPCPGRGALAPVMVQQTKGLGGCRPNPWPARTDLDTVPEPSPRSTVAPGPVS